MRILICFDLHDTLVNSTRAWLKAYKIIRPNDYKSIKKDYKKGMRRKEICKKYNIEYEQLKIIYRKKLSKNKLVMKFYNIIRKKYSTCIITNASLERATNDLNYCNIKYDKLYTSLDGLKPDSKYILKIMKENKSDYLILIGNQKEDKLTLVNTKSYLIKSQLQIISIYIKIKMKCRKCNYE